MATLGNVLTGILALIRITIFNCVIIILKLVPPLYRRFCKSIDERSGMAQTSMDMDDYIWTMGSWTQLKTSSMRIIDAMFGRNAYLGGAAPNSKVVTFEGKIQRHLLDYKKAGRPLVLNFGSCS